MVSRRNHLLTLRSRCSRGVAARSDQWLGRSGLVGQQASEKPPRARSFWSKPIDPADRCRRCGLVVVGEAAQAVAPLLVLGKHRRARIERMRQAQPVAKLVGEHGVEVVIRHRVVGAELEIVGVQLDVGVPDLAGFQAKAPRVSPKCLRLPRKASRFRGT